MSKIYDGLDEDKINNLYASGLIDETTRRDFLKKMGAGAAAVSSGNPLKLLNFGSVDPLKEISDLELMETPEEDWIFAVPYSRLLNIVGNDTEYAKRELSNKLMDLIQYGFKYLAGESSSNKGLPTRRQRMVHKDLNPLKALIKALKDSGVGSIDLFDLFDQEHLLHFFDVYRYREEDGIIDNAADALSNDMSEFLNGIKFPAGRLRALLKQYEKELLEFENGFEDGQDLENGHDEQLRSTESDNERESSPEDFMYLLDVPEDDKYDYETSMEDRIIEQISELIIEHEHNI